MFCSPKYDDGSVSCYDKKTLIKIAKQYNHYYSKKNNNSKNNNSKNNKNSNGKNKYNKITYSNKNKKQLFNEIRKKMVKSCNNNEECWLDQKFINIEEFRNSGNIANSNDGWNNKSLYNSNGYYIGNKKNRIKNKFFRTKLPKKWKKDKNTWLTNFDIYNVMSQYEAKHKDFVFLGPVPSDCPMEVTCELSNLDLKKMLKMGKTKIGVIFNLDVSSGSGTHWVALYIDLKDCSIYYYDSYGFPPIRRIQKFINFLRKKCVVDLKKEFHFEYNKKRHQYGNSECGVYSMFILEQLLNGGDFKKVVSKKIPDKKMNDLRFKKYFRVD